MKRWNLIVLLGFLPSTVLFFGLGVLRLQAAPGAATIVVDTTTDENDGSCVDGDCSLRDAIATAAAGDTIVFDNGLAGGVIDVSANGKLVVDKNLTISGTVPITISGNNLVRVFEIAASTQVNFFSMTIANGSSTFLDCPHMTLVYACGGAVKVLENSEVSVTDVLFVNNTAELGGAIYLSGSHLNVYSSTFMSNTGSGGGGIFVRLINGLGSAVVADSIFVENIVTNSGGAINIGNASPLIIQNSLFANNSAKFGGALAGGAYAHIIVQDSTLRDNSADYGGAIMHGVTDSNLTIQNSTLSGNVAVVSGGAIFSQIDGQMLIENSTISGNSALGSNSGTGGGGAVRMTYDPATSTIRNTTVISNIAPNISGRDGLWLEIGTLTIRNSIVAYNGASNCTVDGGTFSGGNSNMADDNSCAGFIVDDPLLKPLADNGGNTLTHALRPESPAIDRGNNAICLPADQRGFPRPVDGDVDGLAVCDMGAYEADPPPLTIRKSGPVLVGVGDFITYTLTVINSLPLTVTNVVITDAVPVGATYISGGTLVGDVISWTVPNLAGGATLNRQFVVTATATITNSDYRVSAGGGYSATGSLDVVTIVMEPIIGLMASNDSPTTLGSPTTLMATIATGSDVNYIWAFGDGTTGTNPVTTHTYPNTGVFTAVVTATNPLNSITAATLVTITDVAINGLTASNDGPTILGSPTTFMAALTTGTNVNYTWAFGDGETGSGSVTTHTYPDVGVYTAVVTASNSTNTVTATTLVTIESGTFLVYLPTVVKPGDNGNQALKSALLNQKSLAGYTSRPICISASLEGKLPYALWSWISLTGTGPLIGRYKNQNQSLAVPDAILAAAAVRHQLNRTA